MQQLFNAFLLIRVCAFIFCLFFSSFSDSFIFDTFRQRPSFYHPEYSARVLNVDRVIGVELTSRKYRLETFFFLLFRIKGESDFSKQEGKFSVELEKFIAEWKTFPLGLFIHSEELSSQRIFFFDESISVTGNLFESDERKVIREIQWSVESWCSNNARRPHVITSFQLSMFVLFPRMRGEKNASRRKRSLIDQEEEK